MNIIPISYDTIRYDTSPRHLTHLSFSHLCINNNKLVLRSCSIDGWLTTTITSTGIAFRSPDAALLLRSARMAQREHRRPPDQVRAPQPRPVQTRRCPSTSPTHIPTLALLSSVVETTRQRRHYPYHHTQSPSRDDPCRVGLRVHTGWSGIRQWLG